MEKEKTSPETLRHSASHLLAAAVSELWPETKFTIGPSIENGFYYDFDFPQKISEEALPKIEKKMLELQKQNLKFERFELPVDEALAWAKKEGQPYKEELIRDIVAVPVESTPPPEADRLWGDTGISTRRVQEAQAVKSVSFYRLGDFTDLCRGPHVQNTSEIKAFKLLSVAGAYWRGSEKNKMLTRIYGTAFASQKELEAHLNQLEEAKKRDHRKLNQTLNLYYSSEELGQGLVILLPHGTVIAEELEKWAKETEDRWGYVRVFTPHIASEKLFKRTGHVPYYLESMYPPMRMEEKGEGEKEVYYLKPMNCAGHHLVYKSQPRSYRDLPLRIAEYGCVYRYEHSGDIHGLMRVRGPIHQNDAHIFCTLEQAQEEFQKVMELHKYYYDALGLSEKDYYLSFAVRDKNNKGKYLGDDALWDKAEKITLDFIKKSKIPYEIEEGGAAFYGPKVDFNIRTVTGKVFSASTNQLDFFIPKAFELEYVDKDGTKKTPVCIHRAPLGAHVRFVAFLTEHFAGAFPTWLAPVQVKVIPISEKHFDYAKEVRDILIRRDGACPVSTGLIRVSVDGRDETMQARIRDAEIQKVPYILVVGDKEAAAGTVTVRARGEKVQKVLEVEKVREGLEKEVAARSLKSSFRDW